ncbi:tail fiber assembly protein [Serratia sp. T13T92]|uniref:tail fiber assembly protein n=1 Tax=Serratia sp. T13T92 TaxID=3397496 RepID=UPI0039E1C733
MPNYALIKSDVVENIVVWDGKSDIFNDYITVNVDDMPVGIGWSYDRGVFHEPPLPTLSPQELVESAKLRQQALLALVDEITSDWRVALMLGDISETDKTKLATWMNYKKAVKAVNVSMAPDVRWPVKPEV